MQEAARRYERVALSYNHWIALPPVPMTALHVDPPFRALPDDPSRVIAASHDFYHDDVVHAASRSRAAHA